MSLAAFARRSAVVGLLLAVPGLASADAPGRLRLGRVTLALSGGFQHWSLAGLESSLADRAQLFAADGFQLDSADFDFTFSYGLEVQVRLGRIWFLRSQFEWTRLRWDDRDRRFLASLGARSRTPISVSYESRVQTHPVLVALGGGVAREYQSVRIAFSGNLLIAPVQLTDKLEIHIETGTTSEIVSTGTGRGFEADFTVDYLTPSDTTLFVESFARAGSTTVELDEGFWESTILPGSRRIDFHGAGLRLGIRWI